MTIKILLTFFTLIIILILLLIWNPLDIKSYLTDTKVGNLANVIVAISTVVSIFIIASQVDLISRDFIEDHRPYVSVNTLDKRNEVKQPADKPDEIFFSFILTNTGKSIANEINFPIKQACFAEEDAESLADVENCFKKNKINVVSRNSFGSISLYPEEMASLSNESKMKMEKIQKLLEEGKRIYVKLDLAYQGPDFAEGTWHYRSSLIIKLTNKEMLMLSKREEKSLLKK